MMILMISLAVLSFNLSCGSVEVVVERCLCLDGKALEQVCNDTPEVANCCVCGDLKAAERMRGEYKEGGSLMMCPKISEGELLSLTKAVLGKLELLTSFDFDNLADSEGTTSSEGSSPPSPSEGSSPPSPSEGSSPPPPPSEGSSLPSGSSSFVSPISFLASEHLLTDPLEATLTPNDPVSFFFPSPSLFPFP